MEQRPPRSTLESSWLEAVLDSLAEGVLVCDGEGHVRAANPSAERILGLDIERARGRDLRELPWDAVRADGSPVPIDEHPVLLTIETGEPLTHVHVGFLRRPGDQPRWLRVETRLVPTGDAGPPDVVASFSDISEHRRTEETLQERIAFDDVIMRMTARFVAIRPEDTDAEIERTLAEMGTMAGVDRAYVFLFRDGDRADNTHEWVARGVSEESPNLQDLPTDRFPWLMGRLEDREVVHVPRVADLPDHAAAERDEFDREGIRSVLLVPMVRQDQLIGFAGFDAVRDEKRWNRTEIWALRLVAGIFTNALSRVRAHRALELVAAELRHHTEELERVNEQLREAGVMKSEFVAMTSHELRTPLTSILGFTESLRVRRDRLTEQQRDRFVEGIDRQAKRLFRLVDDLMVASRLDAGSLGAAPEEVAVRRFVDEALETLSDPEVVVDVPDELRARVDPDHGRRMVVNLVRNAQKYGRPPITVAATGEDGDDVVVSVTDEGPGVDPGFEDQLFQKFSRADVQASREQGGTGLGLAIVRGLAEVNGGRVSYVPVRPEVEWRGPNDDRERLRGARFSVRLPSA
ncbi:MAG: GAF domain-containing protein [Actinobacteria bacterium]|nr:GAF domain-containing protein [Actinomycetota bacterium]